MKMSENKLNGFSEDLSAMLRARYPLLYLNTCEEVRALEVVGEVSRARSSAQYVWSRTGGITKDGRPVSDVTDPLAALRWFDDLKEKAVFVVKDFHPYLKEPTVVRKLRDMAQSLKRTPKNLILLSPVLGVPAELSKEVAILELPLPNRDEIRELVTKAVNVVPGDEEKQNTPVDEITDAASGLTYDEIENVLAKSIVQKGKLDKRLIQDEKRQIVKRSGVLDFVQTHDDGADIGGLHNLKHWLKIRRDGLTKEARELKLPAPKGILLVGIPGCGKSLTAVTVGKQWQLPLLRLDMGRVFSGLVGSSESNVRAAIATAEAVAPCILWIDEIEKGLSGTQSSGASDGGTTSRVFGTLLTWMQEKKSPVFVVATANDISQLPPEFLRKGRFDEIFFVDLPSVEERREIFDIQLKRYGWEVAELDIPALVNRTDGFSGSEIEQILVSARYLAFGSHETFAQSHLVTTIGETVPLSKTMGEKIEVLRNWATHRARPASRPLEIPAGHSFEMRTHSMEFERDDKKQAGEK